MISDELLKWENEHNVLDFKFQHADTLVWPLIRYTVFHKIVEHTHKFQPAHATREDLGLNKKIDYLYRTIKDNPFAVSRDFKFLFISSTAGICLKVDEKWFGRISDYFAVEYNDQSLVLDKSYRLQYKFPRSPKNVRSHDYMNLYSFVNSKLFGRVHEKDLKVIKELMALLRSSWSAQLNEADYTEIERILTVFSLRLSSLHKHYLKLFHKIKPRVLFIEEGSYGGVSAWIIKWAKDCGIVTCEPQHGCLSLPYMYSEQLSKDAEYGKYLPDHLLLYGQYWAELVRSPSKKVVIGNPHFDTKKQAFTGVKKDGTEKTVLIVSQGTVTNALVEVAFQLSKLFEDKDYKIIFRLHRGEVPFVERYRKLEGLQNIQIDKDQDIYTLIHNSDYIVGAYSLTLFEAAGLDKKIYVLEGEHSSEYVPPGLGLKFKNADELYGLIKQDAHQTVQDGKFFWADGWRENYHGFINSVLETKGA